MALFWAKNSSFMRELEFWTQIPKSTFSRYLREIFTALYCTLDEIKLPGDPNNSDLVHTLGAFGFLDCTAHFRQRINPGQNLLVRHDKGGHSLTVQMVASFTGIPLRVDIGLGHNNGNQFNKTIF